MGKKKSYFIDVILCVFLICLFSACDKASDNKELNMPFLVEEESFLSSFEVVGKDVFFYCHLTIKNPSLEEKRIYILGNFSEDVNGGLIIESEILGCYRDNPKESIFILHPGINQLDVVFVGKHGSNNTKYDRRIPKISIELEQE